MSSLERILLNNLLCTYSIIDHNPNWSRENFRWKDRVLFEAGFFLWHISCLRCRFDHILASICAGKVKLHFLPPICLYFHLRSTEGGALWFSYLGYLPLSVVTLMWPRGCLALCLRFMFKEKIWSALDHLKPSLRHQKDMEDGTSWACSQNALMHNTQHMALRHTEQLSKYITPVPAYVTDTLVRWYPSTDFFAATFLTHALVVVKKSFFFSWCSSIPWGMAANKKELKDHCAWGKKMHLSERV